MLKWQGNSRSFSVVTFAALTILQAPMPALTSTMMTKKLTEESTELQMRAITLLISENTTFHTMCG